MTSDAEGETGLQAEAAARWTRLDWDSTFFGVGIGSVDLSSVDQALLEEIDAQAVAAGISCLYGRLDSSDAERSMLAQHHGYRFVEAAMLFDVHQVEPPPVCPDGEAVRPGTRDDLAALLPIVDSMAAWSRFAADPRFGPDEAVRIQRAWLDRSIDDPTGNRAVIVAEEVVSGEIVAFVGVIYEPDLRIDAVGTTRRGGGAARYLVEHVRSRAAGRPLFGGPIAARNVLAQRFVVQTGSRVKTTEYIFHRWLD